MRDILKLVVGFMRLAVLMITALLSATVWILRQGFNGAAGLVGGNRAQNKRRRNSTASAQRAAPTRKREPPTAAEFRAARIDYRLCGRCQQAIKKMNYVFMLEGVPTVFCPSCWSKATSPMQSQEKLDAWWARLTSLYDRRTSVLR